MKSSDRILAQRYAQAYNELGASDEEAQRNDAALQTAASALKQVAPFMQDPKVTLAQKKEFVSELFTDEKTLVGFISLLIDAKRYYLLPEITAQSANLLDLRLGQVRADVVSAQVLGDAQRARVEETVQQLTGRKAVAEYRTDESLIGGLKIVSDGILIDGSIRGQLNRLQDELTK